jgi:hypothetical protein
MPIVGCSYYVLLAASFCILSTRVLQRRFMATTLPNLISLTRFQNAIAYISDGEHAMIDLIVFGPRIYLISVLMKFSLVWHVLSQQSLGWWLNLRQGGDL